MSRPTKELFKVWHLLFDKEYSLNTQEAINRYIIFKAKLAKIKNTNSQGLAYTEGLNQFSDLTKEEFAKIYTTKKLLSEEDFLKAYGQPKKMSLDDYVDEDDEINTKRVLAVEAPLIDYRQFYNPARQQGRCGSCWAFAACGTIEGNMSKKFNKKWEYLSTQDLLDCDNDDNGCSGGNAFTTFPYIQKNGVTTEAAYRYTGVKGTCQRFNKTRLKINGFKYCSNYHSNTPRCNGAGTNNMLSLLSQGPIAVGIDANEIQDYKGGVFTGRCYEDNHAVVLVGYQPGRTAREDVWIVRNSWDTNFGENGYIKVLVNDSNNYSCFVGNEGLLPLV